MQPNEIETEVTRPRTRRSWFDPQVNLGHLLVVFSILTGAAGLYAHDESRLAIIETEVSGLEQQNLPPRVSSLEAQTHDLHDSLRGIQQVLEQIHNDLNAKQDKQK